eukprot:Platyproteum_vivax@DN9276_c0_g1_i1.p1
MVLVSKCPKCHGLVCLRTITSTTRPQDSGLLFNRYPTTFKRPSVYCTARRSFGTVGDSTQPTHKRIAPLEEILKEIDDQIEKDDIRDKLDKKPQTPTDEETAKKTVTKKAKTVEEEEAEEGEELRRFTEMFK